MLDLLFHVPLEIFLIYIPNRILKDKWKQFLSFLRIWKYYFHWGILDDKCGKPADCNNRGQAFGLIWGTRFRFKRLRNWWRKQNKPITLTQSKYSQNLLKKYCQFKNSILPAKCIFIKVNCKLDNGNTNIVGDQWKAFSRNWQFLSETVNLLQLKKFFSATYDIMKWFGLLQKVWRIRIKSIFYLKTAIWILLTLKLECWSIVPL